MRNATPQAEGTSVEQLHGLERLGDTYEFGSLLIRLAGFRGWTLQRQPGFAGVLPGVYRLVRAGEATAPRRGRVLADVATGLFLDAMNHDRKEPQRVSTTRAGA